MKPLRTVSALPSVIALLLFFTVATVMPAFAGTTGSSTALTDPNKGDSANIRANAFLRLFHAKRFGPTEMGGSDVIQNGQSQGTGTVDHAASGPIQIWPVPVPALTSTVPTMRDTAISKDLLKTTGYPVSDTQFQLIERMDHNIMLEQMSDPERTMWQSTTQSGMQAGSAANSAAGMTTNQGQSAIQFQEKFLKNFTSEAGNRWLLIRDRLFIPIAVLLLLPGAVLCQVKAIVAQGSNVLGETSPFEGIFRSIIAIFMIPGTLLVINYGIDVSNSVHFTIADEYTRIFGTDMYHDAQCALWRAFPVNAQQSNKNAIRAGGQDTAAPQGNASFSSFEALNLDVRRYDPCATPVLDQSMVADEDQNQDKLISRLALNGTNTALTATWNILCAFQEAFLFYLFCMGPIAAALWVWPVKGLRSALPSWVEGVIILCFWSLFWNTVVLLMACFRGVSDTGTVIMSALNFLSTIVTQYAFDFVGLVTNGASSGVSSAINQAASKASQGMGGGGGGGGGGKGAAGAAGGAPHGKGDAHANAAAQKAGALSPQGKAMNAGLAGANAKMAGSALNGGSGPPPPGHADSATTTGAAKPLTRGGIQSADAQPPKDGGVHPGVTPPPDAKIDHPPVKPIGDAGAVPGTDPTKGPNSGLHLDANGGLSLMGNHKGEAPPTALSDKQKEHLAGQIEALNKHDADQIKSLAGPNADGRAMEAAYHGQLSQNSQNAIADHGKNLGISADGHLINTATGEALKVGGLSGMPPEGLAMGGGQSPSGLAPMPGGDAVHLHAGMDAGLVNGAQVDGLAKSAHVDASQMSLLTGGQNGGADIVGPNGQPLATQGADGHFYAPGSHGQVMLDQNGSWVAASTGTP